MLSGAWRNRTLTRTLSPALRIEPFTTASTPSSLASSASDRAVPWATAPEEREMTFNEPIWARSAMSPSVIPSAEVRAVRAAREVLEREHRDRGEREAAS